MKNKDNFGIFDRMIVTEGKTKKLVQLRPMDWIGYSNNKEFIGALATSWIRFHESLNLSNVITPEVLLNYLSIYHIRNNKGQIYMPFTNSTTSLLKASYNYYEKLRQEEQEKLKFEKSPKRLILLQQFGKMANVHRHMFTKEAIAQAFVNKKGKAIIQHATY